MKVTDFVVLAGGFGKRLWPITNTVPKPMVRLAGKPLLDYTVSAVEGLEAVGRIVLVVSHKREVVEKHFVNRAKVVFVRQEKPMGTADALAAAAPFVESDDVVVVNGDNFYEPKAFKEFLATGLKAKDFFVAGKRVGDCRNFGALKERNGLLESVVEKPVEGGPGLASAGIFRVPKEFLDFAARVKPSPRGELEATDALNAFAAENEVRVREFSGFATFLTYFWDYLDANAFVLEHVMPPGIEGELDEDVVVKGKVFVGEGTVVKNGSRIEGPVYVGRNSVIGPHAFLRPGTTIEDECHVGSSELKNSVLMSGSNAPHFNYVGDSVVCEDVNLGAGAITANLRFDNKEVFAEVQGARVPSGKAKLGCVVGAGTKIGINASITCGMLVGSNCRIYPRAFVKENLSDYGVLKE